MRAVHTVAVYLGSRPGNEPKFVHNASELGRILAENHIDIVYGGASVGTMKALADGALDAGGRVVGVFPTGFKGKKDNAAAGIEVGPKSLALTELIEVRDLPERIATMERLSDAMIFLPGSFGTMVEAFTWMEKWQLGWGQKPAFILNSDGYYDGLLAQFRAMIAAGFMDGDDMQFLTVCPTPEALVNTLLSKM